MKKLMLGAVCIVLGFAANAEVEVKIGDLYYSLDDTTKTAEVTLSYQRYSMATVEIPASVTDGVKSYAVTSIGYGAFQQCTALKSVSAPFVTSIGESAFSNCKSLESVYAPSVTSIGKSAFGSSNSLTSLTVNSVMKEGWDSNMGGYGLGSLGSNFKVTFDPRSAPTLTSKQVAQAEWKAETTLTVSTALKSGDTTLDKAAYENACLYYGIEAKAEPTAEDFKVVSKDAQVVQEGEKVVPKDAQVVGEGEIAVKKESIQAAKAETISIANNEIQLGVSVMSNSNITAEIANWGKVNLASENVKVENGNVVITIPVDSASGFMILQSKDAKVNNVPDIIIEDR